MAHAPWYKRYPADFNADPYVQAMTAEQYGWFSAMLDAAWLHTPQGYIPNAIDLLCRMVGRCDEMYFAKHSKIVIDRFKVTEDGKFLYHPKMMEQVGHLSQVSEKRSDAGKKGAITRWNNKDSNCHIPVKQLPTDSDSDSDKDKTSVPLSSSKDGFTPLDCAIGFCTDLGYTGVTIRRDAEQAIALRVQLRKLTPQVASDQIKAEWLKYDRETTSYKKGISKWLSECNQGVTEKPAPPKRDIVAEMRAERERIMGGK